MAIILSDNVLEIIKFQQDCYKNFKNTFLVPHTAYSTRAALMKQLSEIKSKRALRQDEAQVIDQISTLEALLKRKDQSADNRINPRRPYFAFFSFSEKGVTKNYFLGDSTYRFGDQQILHWRDSPISRLFFYYGVEEDFAEELAGRVREGIILKRYFLRFAKGELVNIVFDNQQLLFDGQDWNIKLLAPRFQKSKIAFSSNPNKVLMSLRVLLGMKTEHKNFQPRLNLLLNLKQYQTVISPINQVVLAFGTAGSGKTTMSLHRLVWLSQENPALFNLGQMAIFTSRKSIAHYLDSILAGIDAKSHPQAYVVKDYLSDLLYYTFAKHFRVNPDNYTLISATRVKKSNELKDALDLFLRVQINNLSAQLANIRQSLAIDDADDNKMLKLIKELSKLGFLKALVKIANITNYKSPSNYSVTNMQRLKRVLNSCIGDQEMETNEGSILFRAWDLFFSDFSMLEEVIRKIEHISSIGGAEQTIKWFKNNYLHCQDQIIAKFLSSPEEISSSEKIPSHNPLDEDDAAILLYMHRQLGGELKLRGKNISFCSILIDEGQDLSLLEISLLSSLAKQPRNLMISGDLHQQTTNQTGIAHLDQLKSLFKEQKLITNHLSTSYRATKQIMQFGIDLLADNTESASIAMPTKVGPPVKLWQFNLRGAMCTHLYETLKLLSESTTQYSVALLCLNEDIAQNIYNELSYFQLADLRLVLNEAFSFKPGIDVTTIEDAKGLEFDYVFIFDVNSLDFPKSRYMKHLLYTGVTRACFELILYSLNEFSDIIPENHKKLALAG
ncbi:MAG: ATP-binding domain-containing protein [SAR324 cluster bacterium]|nr:ATP-binding domain-containing protein [SAR324 cluster bacterium]